MLVIHQTMSANKLLASLPIDDAERLSQQLVPVSLSAGDSVFRQGEALTHVYFPLDCVISTLAIMEDGATVETSLTGREGLVNIASILGESRARHWTRVLIPGEALQIRAEVLREHFRRSGDVQKALMGCYRRMITQVSQRAVCSSRHTLLHRLCCWLLMVRDRVGCDDIPLTHEAISGQLGARRAGITQAACMLQSMRAISYSRGHIHINDRHLLEQMACECSNIFKEEFEWFENCGGGATATSRYSKGYK